MLRPALYLAIAACAAADCAGHVQARPVPSASEVQQQPPQKPLTVLQMSRQGSRGESKSAGERLPVLPSLDQACSRG